MANSLAGPERGSPLGSETHPDFILFMLCRFTLLQVVFQSLQSLLSVGYNQRLEESY